MARIDLAHGSLVVAAEILSAHRNHLSEDQLWTDRVALKRARELLVKGRIRLHVDLGTAVLLAGCLSGAHLNRRWQELDQLVELREAALEVQVA